jgi:hypothetical protein
MPDERPTDDERLDETISETFPASDAPANTVETGIQPKAEWMPQPPPSPEPDE